MKEESVYRTRFNDGILMLQQSGLIGKIKNDVRWDLIRSGKGGLMTVTQGKVLKIANSEEKGLTLADTEGMFLLLGIGYLIAGGALVSEWVGGCTNKCIRLVRVRREQKNEEHRVEDEKKEADFLARAALESVSTALGIDLIQANNETHLEIAPESPQCHKSSRSSSVSVQELSPAMLTEMYNGPKNKHANIVMIDGKMMNEFDAMQYANDYKIEADAKAIDENFEFLNSENNSSIDLEASKTSLNNFGNSSAGSFDRKNGSDEEIVEKPKTAPSGSHRHARIPSFSEGTTKRSESVDGNGNVKMMTEENSKIASGNQLSLDIINSNSRPSSNHDRKVDFDDTLFLIPAENQQLTKVEINLQAPTPTDAEEFFGEKIEPPKIKRRSKKHGKN